jgi:hypothetical protein
VKSRSRRLLDEHWIEKQQDDSIYGRADDLFPARLFQKPCPKSSVQMVFTILQSLE